MDDDPGADSAWRRAQFPWCSAIDISFEDIAFPNDERSSLNIKSGSQWEPESAIRNCPEFVRMIRDLSALTPNRDRRCAVFGDTGQCLKLRGMAPQRPCGTILKHSGPFAIQ